MKSSASFAGLVLVALVAVGCGARGAAPGAESPQVGTTQLTSAAASPSRLGPASWDADEEAPAAVQTWGAPAPSAPR